jgi:hypothetical protein
LEKPCQKASCSHLPATASCGVVHASVCGDSTRAIKAGACVYVYVVDARAGNGAACNETSVKASLPAPHHTLLLGSHNSRLALASTTGASDRSSSGPHRCCTKFRPRSFWLCCSLSFNDRPITTGAGVVPRWYLLDRTVVD